MSTLVNKCGRDGEDLCMPLEEYTRKTKAEGILKFFQPVEKRKREETKVESIVEVKRSKIDDALKKTSSPSK